MKIVKNLAAVADAPIVDLPLLALTPKLATSRGSDEQFYVVVSKQTKPLNSTTVYDANAHIIYRATHKHGMRCYLREVAQENPAIWLLEPGECLSTSDAEFFKSRRAAKAQ